MTIAEPRRDIPSEVGQEVGPQCPPNLTSDLRADHGRKVCEPTSAISSIDRRQGSRGVPEEFDAYDLLNDDGSEDDLPYLPLLGRDGYIVQGWSHLISAYPRTGKTELLTTSIHDWLRSDKRVLCFSEEPRTIWRYRIQGRPEWCPGLRVVLGLGEKPDRLLALMEEADKDIIVVDAIRNLLQPHDETDNSELARVINPWVASARACGKTLVLVHHDRKTAGDHGKGIAGGHALLGAVDIALQVLADPKIENRRKIKAYTRVIQPPDLLYEMGLDKVLHPLGDAGELALAEVKRRILARLPDTWTKTADVRALLGEPTPSDDQVRKGLTELAREGAVQRDPDIIQERVAGKTVKWRRVQLAAGVQMGVESIDLSFPKAS